jgi:hypothetical protein
MSRTSLTSPVGEVPVGNASVAVTEDEVWLGQPFGSLSWQDLDELWQHEVGGEAAHE